MKISNQKPARSWSATAARALREFTLPILGASAWTGYSWWATPSFDIKAGASAFFSSLFFLAYFTGQFVRISKQAAVERGFRGIEDRFGDLVQRLEAVSSELVGHVNGGDSVCWLQFGMNHSDAKVSWLAKHIGTYTVRNIDVCIADIQHPSQIVRTKLDALLPHHVQPLCSTPASPVLIDGISFYSSNVLIYASNGAFVQRARLALVHDVWLSASFVTKDASILHWEIQKGFPLSLLKKDSEWPTWQALVSQ